MTILVNYTGRNGGGPIFAYEMTRGLIKNGVEVVAVISADVENLDKWRDLPLKRLITIPTYKNKLTYILNTLLFTFKQKKQIKSQLKNINIDKIYVPMLSQWTYKINKIFKKVDNYVTIHDPIPHSGEKWYLKNKSNINEKKAKKLIVLSKEFIEYVSKKYGKDVIWIPHGRFSYYKEYYFTQYIESEQINFLFFGRLTAYKGLDILAEAFKICQDKMDNYTLTIAGPGDWSKYKDSFEGVKNFNIVNKWFTPIMINDLFKLKNTITILPYKDSTQSGVIPIAKEYLSPIIASNTGGMKEQIDNEKTGILVTPNPKALSEAILSAYNNKQHSDELAKNAYNQLEELNWDRLADVLLKNMREEICY